MSPERIAQLAYRRRDDDLKVTADITDAELREVVHALYCRLPAASRQWFRDKLAADETGVSTMSDLAAKVYGAVGTPRVIDMAQRKLEEESGS